MNKPRNPEEPRTNKLPSNKRKSTSIVGAPAFNEVKSSWGELYISIDENWSDLRKKYRLLFCACIVIIFDSIGNTIKSNAALCGMRIELVKRAIHYFGRCLDHLRPKWYMQQLRQELDKETELRKIAEDKLLELLDYEKRMEVQKRENEKRKESKGTQMDLAEIPPESSLAENGSPLLLGYDGRLRKYQTYIAKLENDNLMLVNELKKFKDLSPRSQEEQAKYLVEKLGQMERNNHQQQIQYETCLDEVANKLVQTLLAQKRLEEECKVLHLRVEQLEQENGTLMEFIEDDKEDKNEKTAVLKSEPTNSYLQLRKPSHHPLTSSPLKKGPAAQKSSISSEEQKDSPKSTNASPIKGAYSEPKSPIISPIAKLGSASKIPSFSSAKPALVRKKSETDMLPSRKSKNDALARETSSSELVPNSKQSSALPSPRTRLPNSSKTPKSTSAKRKRLSRNESPAEKGAKDSKQRIKSNHIRWDSRKVSSEEIAPSFKNKDCVNQISPIPTFPQPQQVWSFNCELSTDLSVPEIKRKVAASIDELGDKLDMMLGVDLPDDLNGKQNSSTSDSSTTIEGANRTRDEGYSTMSSDLQPDSTADTTISEPEHSTTYVIIEKDIICGSDDSVTECLDGSMCSSSDSGFGPLHQVATLKTLAEEEPNRIINELPKFDSNRKHGTIKCKEQIASVKPTVRSTITVCDQTQNSVHADSKSNSVCDQILTDCESLKNESSRVFHEYDNFSSSSDKRISVIDQSTMIDYMSFPKEILGLTNYRNSWHLGLTKSIGDDKIVFCNRHSYIDDNIFDEKIETAEKATLTEPEEELWREKALAPFIDESIWSLYSSEGDIQVKHFPNEPLLSEPSLEKLITNCSPCIIVTENVESNPQTETSQPTVFKSSTNSSATDLNHLAGQNTEQFKSGLERVASDTVLYLKDAIHELEDSMRRGLKSSKNIPALHQNSGSESESSPSRGISFKPEILRTLEATMSGQNHLAWPSPTRSSSLSSVQSCMSCHVVSDEMEDVDMIRTSQKGSRDNDLNSASDGEYENLEHRDFVERWLQKEIVSSSPSKATVSHLEPVAEIGEYPTTLIRRTSLPVESPIAPKTRARFMSYPNDSNTPGPSVSLFPVRKTEQVDPTPSSDPLFENDCVTECIPEYIEEATYIESLDPEAKEFNGDFYTLCNIGSLKSLDRFSPSKARDMTVKQLVESPIFNRKAPPKSLSKTSTDKLKPTGLVKPTRPLSLSFTSVPSVPERATQKSSTGSKESDSHAKPSICSKVPPNNFSVFQNATENKKKSSSSPASECSSSEKSPMTCLPTRIAATASVKPKSPTKIVFRTESPKSDDASKRQQWKRDRIVARRNRLKEGCGTAWVHLQPNPALSDPTMRSSLLDSIKAPTSSSGSSGTEEEDNDVLVIQTNSHLHRICKERRHKVKASANNPLYDMKKRSSIVGRRELFYRFGDKEKEAIACFDFLEKIPSIETLNKLTFTSVPPPEESQPVPPSHLSLSGRQISSVKERISLLSPTVGDTSKMAAASDHPSKMADLAKSPFSSYSARKLRLPNLWNKPLSHNMSSSTLNSQDCELLDHISLSDSCAESYSSTPESYDDAS
ncbi:uncharacterized protein CDAR_429791 [Caerostris darwini]|uniref:Nck-associated protein 5 n=1 Tax=Caerostris darwini TaxID=1538125 RepID=A0AAV4VTQ1_9ARAC|nr:uncharacterized protein CDAR_429791 [Caerostris darwini]